MRTRILYLGTLIVGLGIWTVFVQRQNQRLREQVAGLRAQLKGDDMLRSENARLKAVLTRQQSHGYELERLRREAQDVVRLRGEVTALRDLREENQKLTTEIYQFSNQLQTAIQIAKDWRDYSTTARAGKLTNSPIEFVGRSGEGTASAFWPERQLTDTEAMDVRQPREAAGQPQPGLVTPMLGSSVERGQTPGSLPADHARFSNQDCASCHGRDVNLQGKMDSEALLGTAKMVPSRH